MPTRYEIYLCRDTGERLVLLSQYLELQYQIVQQEAGFCHIVVPGTFDASYIRPDYKIAIWRQPDGGSMALEDVYLIRFYRRYTTAQGQRRYEIVGANGNSIMVERAPYCYFVSTSPTAGNQWEDHADDAVKAIVRYAMTVSSAGIDPAQFSVEANTAMGVSFKKPIKYRSLADEALARLETSQGRNGVPMFWHVVALSEAEYQLRTYINQIGQDRTWPDGYNPILVSEESGTMSEANYTWDGIEARNYVIALGATLATNVDRRYKSQVYDRLQGAFNTLSAYSHRDSFVDAGSIATEFLADEGREELALRIAKETFTFKLKESQTQRYGRDWRFGDKITAFYDKYYTCRIRGVTVTKNSADAPEEIAIDMDIVPSTSPQEDA